MTRLYRDNKRKKVAAGGDKFPNRAKRLRPETAYAEFVEDKKRPLKRSVKK